MNENRSKLFFVFSMCIFGTISLAVRNIPLSSGETALMRAVIATVGILLYMLITRQKLSLSSAKADAPLLLLSGAMMGANWIFFFGALKYTTVAIATLSYYFSPVLVMILSPLLFREKLTAKQIVCFVFATIGLVLVIGVGGGDSGNYMLGIAFGLIAAVLYTGIVLINKRIKNVTGMSRTILQFAAAIAVLIPYVAIDGGFHVHTLRGAGLISLLVLGLFHTGLAYCIYFSFVGKLRGQQVAILSYMDPVVAVIVSVAILGESITVGQIIGGVLILGFSLLNELELPVKKS